MGAFLRAFQDKIKKIVDFEGTDYRIRGKFAPPQRAAYPGVALTSTLSNSTRQKENKAIIQIRLKSFQNLEKQNKIFSTFYFLALEQTFRCSRVPENKISYFNMFISDLKISPAPHGNNRSGALRGNPARFPHQYLHLPP